LQRFARTVSTVLIEAKGRAEGSKPFERFDQTVSTVCIETRKKSIREELNRTVGTVHQTVSTVWSENIDLNPKPSPFLSLHLPQTP
jgi:predicted GTPase